MQEINLIKIMCETLERYLFWMYLDLFGFVVWIALKVKFCSGMRLFNVHIFEQCGEEQCNMSYNTELWRRHAATGNRTDAKLQR